MARFGRFADVADLGDAELQACVANREVSAVCAATASWRPGDVVRVLDALGAGEHAISTADVAPMFARANPAIDARLVKLDARGRLDLPLEWLLTMAFRSREYSTERLAKLLEREATPEERRLARALVEDIDREYRDECKAVGFEVELDDALARLDDTDDAPWVLGMELLPALRRFTM